MNYLRANALEQVAQLLRADPEARLLAGGQSLLAAMRLGLAAPSQLIDLQALPELHGIVLQPNSLSIGAMCTHAQIASEKNVAAFMPMLAQVAAGIGDQQIRHQGTIGGSVANHDPAACWPAALLAANATLHTSQQSISADDFFTGMFGTILQSDEILLRIEFPAFALPAQAHYEKFEQLASRFALTGVAMVASAHGVRIAITGLGAGACRWPEGEQAFETGNTTLTGIDYDATQAYDDLHASARYRAHLVKVLSLRCWKKIHTHEGLK
jgi:aerobic carbon-monoxide dehydrogenase medium subunit